MITTATPKTIGNLKPGASVTTKANDALDILENDTTVAHTASTKVYTYNYPVTVADGIIGGTVTVDPTSGAPGTTVTVTATADEGYELEAVYVDGVEIVAVEGVYTFQIDAEAENVVTATFAEAEAEGFPTSGTIDTDATYVLTENVTMDGVLTIDTDAEVTIDLAGYEIHAKAETNGVFNVLGKLTVLDNSEKKTGKIVSHGVGSSSSTPAVKITSGSFTLDGGEITGWVREGGAGGMVYVLSGATFNMNGGKLTGASALNGSAIRNAGTVYMNGGEISENIASAGAAVQVEASGVFEMTNGTIKNNSGTDGGAINNRGTVTISGGTISGNDAKEGGAIFNRYNTATLTISGGTITGNTATASGGAIYNRDAALAISGGAVIDDLYIHTATSATIGNLQSGAYVKSNAALTIADNDETVYTADNLVYQFVDDVQLGFADKLKPGATVTVEEGDSLGGGIVLTEAGDYILDLAGQTLTGTAAPYFTIGEGVKLTVIDSSEAGTGKIVGLTNATNAMILVNGGSFSLAGGLLTGHTNTGLGGAIYASTDGSYVAISGGEISGNTAKRGGAISGPNTASAIDVTIEITGGIVTGNATDRGATMYTQTGATVTIEGGKVGFGTINGEPADVTTSGKEDVWIRSSNFAISGGEIGDVFFNGDAANGYTMAITGKTTIHLLNGVTEETATIGNLVTGARVATVAPKPLSGTGEEGAFDETVHVKNNLYRFIDDVGPVTRILFVGNSFAGDTTTYLNDLGNFFNIEVESAYLYIGSQNIRWHAQSLAETLRNVDLNGDGVIGDSRSSKDELYDYAGQENVSIPDAMTDGEWDYVVLQPGVQYVGYEGTYNSDINFLADYIRKVQPTAKILWSQIWAVDNLKYTTTDVDEGTAAEDAYWSMASNYLAQFGGSQAAMYDAILYNTDKFIAGDDARFADVINGWLPIGIAIQEMRNGYTDDSTLESYLATRLTRDGFHLSPNAGRMIAGLTVMKTLFPDQVDLTTMTTEDVTGLFNNDYSNDYRADTFEATDENVTKLLNAVATACGHAADGTVPEYGNGTANKQFNPDAVMANGAEYVAVYEGITEVGQVATDEFYATTGAGKIVVYEDGKAVATIDELWLEENAGIVLTNRYEKLTNKETYYIQADPQVPQLAVIGTTLYMTFDVKLYADEQNTIVNGGIHLISCDTANGDEWTYIGKISDAPMAYGLTAISDGLIMSVADTSTKVLKLDASGNVTKTVELCADIADVAFAEVDGTVWALASTGEVYFSADNGASWTATAIDAGDIASPDMVALAKKGVYVTWADEAELKVYSKVWTFDKDDTATYGWNNTEATVVAEYAPATAYNGKSTGGQPATFVCGITSDSTKVKTYFASDGEVASDEHEVITVFGKQLLLESNPIIRLMYYTSRINAVKGTTIEVTRTYSDGREAVNLKYAVGKDCENGSYYEALYDGIGAKEMGDNVFLAIYDEGGRQVTMLEKTSVQTELEKILNKATSTSNPEVLKVLAVDMLNYGAAAQEYFHYDEEHLVTANLTAEQQALASDKLAVDAQGLAELKKDYVSAAATVAKSPYLENAIEVHLEYLKSDSTYGAGVAQAHHAIAEYTTHDGVVVTGKELPVTDSYVTGTSMPSMNVVLNFLAAADVRTPITVNLCDAAGNEIAGTEIVYTISTYAASSTALGNGYDEANELDVLVMRMMQYGDSAYAYFHRNDKA